MKYECEIIQDLIPLVKDGIASEKSRAAAVQHINECPVCRGVYDADAQIFLPNFSESQSMEMSKVTLYKNRIKRRRKVMISLNTLFAVILVIVFVLFAQRLIAGDSYTSSDIAEYGKYYGHFEFEQEGFFSGLEIFPKIIPSSAKVTDYYYYGSNGGLFDNSYQLYLVCTYSEEDFASEKKRLETIELKLMDVIHRPLITDEGFRYPAVVMIFGYKDSFEYALIDAETRTIVYVYVQTMGLIRSVVPQQYRPQGFRPPQDELNIAGTYNIYYFEITDEDYYTLK